MTNDTKDGLKKKIDKCKYDSTENDEKLKEEMLTKLKDLGNIAENDRTINILGNMVLRPFGLSTDAFQVNDDGHGGKTISMKQPNA